MVDNVRRTDIADLWAEVLDKTGELWIGISGDSMLPVVHNGDSVLVRRATVSDIGQGDIVTFRRGGILITHRVIGIVRDASRTMIIEKGDRSLRPTMIDSDDVAGKVIALRRGPDTWSIKGPQESPDKFGSAGQSPVLQYLGVAYSFLLKLKHHLIGNKSLGLQGFALSVWARVAGTGTSR